MVKRSAAMLSARGGGVRMATMKNYRAKPSESIPLCKNRVSTLQTQVACLRVPIGLDVWTFPTPLLDSCGTDLDYGADPARASPPRTI